MFFCDGDIKISKAGEMKGDFDGLLPTAFYIFLEIIFIDKRKFIVIKTVLFNVLFIINSSEIQKLLID